MKLRIKSNTLRLRLTRSEVAAVVEHGRVEDAITFAPGAALRYAVELSPAAERVEARLADGRITVVLPDADARAWAASDRQVGLSAEQALAGVDGADAGVVAILVEKDFACLDRRAEDEDAFAPPADHRC